MSEQSYGNHLDPAADRIATDLLAHIQALMPAGPNAPLLTATGAMMAVRNAAPAHFSQWSHTQEMDLITSIMGSLIFGQAAIIENAARRIGQAAPPAHLLRAEILNRVYSILIREVTEEFGPLAVPRPPAAPRKEAS